MYINGRIPISLRGADNRQLNFLTIFGIFGLGIISINSLLLLKDYYIFIAVINVRLTFFYLLRFCRM